MSTNTEWLQTLKPGDTVIVNHNPGLDACKVDRVTATQIIIGKTRYRRKSGYEVERRGWYGTNLVKPTSEILERILRLELVAKILGSRGRLLRIRLETLQRIVSELEEVTY